MILNIAVLALILAITFMHSLFGLFSGLINAMCAITAMCVALGFSEAVNALAVEQGMPPSYSLAVTLMVLFVVTHLVLRLAADNLIRGNVHVPRALDVGGGAVCGALIAMISVGMLVMAFLALPFGGRVAKFSRYERTENVQDDGLVKFERRSVWLKPDEFTAGLFSLLSGGSLKHQHAFAEVYPSFAEWVTWTGNTVQPESATSPGHDSKADGFGSRGLAIQTWWVHKGSLDAYYRTKLPAKGVSARELEFKPLAYKPAPGKQLVGVRLKLMAAAADPHESARVHRFRPSMLRVVGVENGVPRQYVPRALGGVIAGEDKIRLVDVDNNFALSARENETLVEAYFEVGEDFEPRFAEYRRFARAVFPKEKAAAAPADRLVGEDTSSAKSRASGAFMQAVVERGTGCLSELPYALSASKLRAMAGVELKDGALKCGRIHGLVEDLTGAGGDKVKQFVLPEGQGLFQLRFKARRAASLAGKVFDFVASVTNQYMAVARGGERYSLAGYYAVVKRSGADYLELYLTCEEEAAAGRSMLEFKQITNTELRERDTEIGLLFFVRLGEVITGVENQKRQGVEFAPPGYKIQ